MPGPKPKFTKNRPTPKGRIKSKDVFKAFAKNAEGRRKGKVPGQRALPPKWQAAKDARITPKDSGRSKPNWSNWFMEPQIDTVILGGDYIQATEMGIRDLIAKVKTRIVESLGIPDLGLASPEQSKMADEPKQPDPKASRILSNGMLEIPMRNYRVTEVNMSIYPDWGEPMRDTRTPEQRERDDLKNRLAVAQQDLKRQNDTLQKLAAAAHTICLVVDIRGDRMTVADGGRQVDCHTFAGAKVGDHVACNADTMQVVSVLTGISAAGQLANVKSVPGSGQVEIDGSGVGEGRVLRCTVPVQAGDQIIFDNASGTVLQNLGRPKSQLAWEQPTNCSWDDIGGHEDAKKALRDAIETPVKHPDLFRRYGRRPTKGVLLYGPPGTGKTLLAKAAATALAHVHGRDVAAGFIYVKGPELLSKWVGESESGIRALFKAARDHKKEHGYPAVVFIDEAESILGKRGDSGRSFMTQTLVPQFLAEMDGLEDSGCLLILATNRAGDLDAAVTREGRIDRKVHVDRPKTEDTERIAAIHLRNRPVADGSDTAGLAALVSMILHTEPVGKLVGPNKTVPITLSSFSSGAMIAGIVEEAATAALNRDIAAEDGSVSGLTPADIREGVKKATEGLMGLDHTAVLQEILAQNPEVLTGHPEEHKIAIGAAEESMSN